MSFEVLIQQPQANCDRYQISVWYAKEHKRENDRTAELASSALATVSSPFLSEMEWEFRQTRSENFHRNPLRRANFGMFETAPIGNVARICERSAYFGIITSRAPSGWLARQC